MAYSRRQVEDHKTIMNADLYNNLQDGIDETKKAITETQQSLNNSLEETQQSFRTSIDEIKETINTVKTKIVLDATVV